MGEPAYRIDGTFRVLLHNVCISTTLRAEVCLVLTLATKCTRQRVETPITYSCWQPGAGSVRNYSYLRK